MPTIEPTFQDLFTSGRGYPSVGSWFRNEGGVLPDVIAPYLAAHGFKPLSFQPYRDDDGEFAGWLVGMNRTKFVHSAAVADLLGSMTTAYNEGLLNNHKRYTDLLRNFGDLLAKTQQHLDAAKASLDTQLALHMTTLDNLEDVYDEFFAEVRTDLDGLAITLEADRTRVNNQFDALLSQSDQNLMNRGFYSSAMNSTIDAGIEERRALALTEISEREKRLIAEIALRKNEVYVNVLRMRSGLIQSKMELTNRDQQFLAYQLDTRNNLALAMFALVERREDAYPGLGDMASLVTSLGNDS